MVTIIDDFIWEKTESIKKKGGRSESVATIGDYKITITVQFDLIRVCREFLPAYFSSKQ